MWALAGISERQQRAATPYGSGIFSAGRLDDPQGSHCESGICCRFHQLGGVGAMFVSYTYGAKDINEEGMR